MHTTLEDIENCLEIDSHFYCLHNQQITEMFPELLPIEYTETEAIPPDHTKRINKTIKDFCKGIK